MTASSEPWAALFESLQRLKAGWPSPAWEWDGRMQSCSSAFSAAQAAQARASTILALPHEWTGATQAGAPALLRTVTGRTGGLRSGQLAFSSDLIEETALAFGLWWPWGGGGTISLRVGLAGVDTSSPQVLQLREILGVK